MALSEPTPFSDTKNRPPRLRLRLEGGADGARDLAQVIFEPSRNGVAATMRFDF